MWNPVVGQFIVRLLAEDVPMHLRVTEVTEDRIYCGARGVGYAFDRETGTEIDEEIGWGLPPLVCGSRIVGIVEE
jgi:hypothetical protein